MKKENFDLALILIWPIIATILSLILKYNAFSSVIVFLVIPTVFLSIKGKEYVKKCAIFALIPAIVMIIIDYIAHITGTWLIPNSILPFRLFGIVTFELVIWTFFMAYYYLIFYEYFLNKHVTKEVWKPRMKILFGAVFLILIFFLIILFRFPTLLKIHYFYLSFGTLLILLPVLFEIIEYPKVFSKFSIAAAYFFFFTFMYEVTALKLGWWAFPGTEFIGWIEIFGVRFPFEELLFCIILTVLAVLSMYEFFDDDEK